MQKIQFEDSRESNRSQRNLRHQSGQSLVEYLIIVALVGVATMGVMRAVSQNLRVQFAKVAVALGGKVEGKPEAESVSKGSYQKSDLHNFMRGASGKKSDSGDDSEGESPLGSGFHPGEEK